MKKQELKNKLIEEYFYNKQNADIASMEVLDFRSPNSGPFSISTVINNDFSTYLFDIRNYNSFISENYGIRTSLLQPDKFIYNCRFDSDLASHAPFYHARENIYTIHKFSSITRDDIIRCAKHYYRKVLGLSVFNVKWYEFKDEKNLQYEFDSFAEVY